ncbi:MAG TPA: R3H domain-containing nucleic acid-binding protein [Patescibacteria group bacterium]
MESIKLTVKELKTIEKVVAEFVKELEIDGSFSVVENGELIDVIMETRDTGIVIGYHGEILDSLQLTLSLAIAKQLGRFIRVSLEVDGYKKNRIEYLQNLAEQVKDKALNENKEQVLMSLKPWERRVIHVYLQNDDQVTSESSGEGRERVLLVKPKA